MIHETGFKKVAIQGVEASFHDVAARKYFEAQNVRPIECPSFKVLCEKLENKDADVALMAIENTIAGSILTNYSLLERYRFKIFGEVYLRIEMSIMALPGQDLEDIQFVHSHPMALLQCEDFLFAHAHMKVLEANDTAESAKNITAQKLSGHGAIASALAAQVYGLKLLEQGIETNKLNFTRFLVICRHEDYEGLKSDEVQANKTSIRFETAHRPGSLSDALNILSRHQINLTKIQSVPILGRPYEYSIHADLEWQKRNLYLEAIEEFKNQAQNILQFGEYKKGEFETL